MIAAAIEHHEIPLRGHPGTNGRPVAVDADIAGPILKEVVDRLTFLRDVGLVSTERFRYWTYYRLETSALAPLGTRLGELVEQAPMSNGRRRPCC